MNIRFVSTLTPEDEDRLAPGLIETIGRLLDAVPIAYTLRLETASGKVYQRAHAARDVMAPGMVESPIARPALPQDVSSASAKTTIR